MIRQIKSFSHSVARSGQPKPKPKSKRPVSKQVLAERKATLQKRRQLLFEREFDYIPCRQFLRANAEQLATNSPLDAKIPLEQRALDSTAAKGLSPYLASLYKTRLLTKDEEQFYFRRMNWLKFRAATTRGRLDQRRATLKQIDQIECALTEAETVKAILITSNLRLVVSIAKKMALCRAMSRGRNAEHCRRQDASTGPQ